MLYFTVEARNNGLRLRVNSSHYSFNQQIIRHLESTFGSSMDELRHALRLQYLDLQIIVLSLGGKNIGNDIERGEMPFEAAESE